MFDLLVFVADNATHGSYPPTAISTFLQVNNKAYIYFVYYHQHSFIINIGYGRKMQSTYEAGNNLALRQTLCRGLISPRALRIVQGPVRIGLQHGNIWIALNFIMKTDCRPV